MLASKDEDTRVIKEMSVRQKMSVRREMAEGASDEVKEIRQSGYVKYLRKLHKETTRRDYRAK